MDKSRSACPAPIVSLPRGGHQPTTRPDRASSLKCPSLCLRSQSRAVGRNLVRLTWIPRLRIAVRSAPTNWCCERDRSPTRWLARSIGAAEAQQLDAAHSRERHGGGETPPPGEV